MTEPAGPVRAWSFTLTDEADLTAASSTKLNETTSLRAPKILIELPFQALLMTALAPSFATLVSSRTTLSPPSFAQTPEIFPTATEEELLTDDEVEATELDVETDDDELEDEVETEEAELDDDPGAVNTAETVSIA
jgi:hypothetical protein